MEAIAIIGWVLILIYIKRKNNIEKKQKSRLDNEKAIKKRLDDVKKKRLDELNNETITIVYESVNENGKPTAIAKRADNTFVTIERENKRFEVSEKIRLAKNILNQWNWYNEETYQIKLDTKRRQDTERKEQEDKLKQQSEFLNNFKIKYIYHITHKSNLENILQNGLLSHNQARKSKLTKVDIADNQVNDRRSRKEPIYNRSIHDYVPLYFNPRNPMLFKRSDFQNDIIILAIDRNLIYQKDTVFSDGNAAANATSFFVNPEDLIKLNWNCINNKYWDDFNDGKRIICSEVLVFPNIPTTSIKIIYCNNLQTHDFIYRTFTDQYDIDVSLNTKLYF
jgi:hypothetical protein